MKKRVYPVFAALLMLAVTLSGCGAQIPKITENTSTGKPSAAILTGSQSKETSAEEAANTQTQIIKAETVTFEYEIRELSAKRDNNLIYGVAYIPLNTDGPLPAVIYAHGYGVTHRNGIQYAEKLAEHGYIVYCFDFCGGSADSLSDGSPLEMSVLTEQADLEAVIDMVTELDYVDSDRIFLFGASQGGLVSGITAADNKEKLRGLILLYPGFEIVETVQSVFSDKNEIPGSYHFMWMTVGRRYFEDVWDYNVYDVIGEYDKDVLMIHGDSDGIVPLSSSERALEVYPSAELKILPGAGHGLHGQDAEKAVEYMLEYLRMHCN